MTIAAKDRYTNVISSEFVNDYRDKLDVPESQTEIFHSNHDGREAANEVV